jgi:hypothetical protein
MRRRTNLTLDLTAPASFPAGSGKGLRWIRFGTRGQPRATRTARPLQQIQGSTGQAQGMATRHPTMAPDWSLANQGWTLMRPEWALAHPDRALLGHPDLTLVQADRNLRHRVWGLTQCMITLDDQVLGSVRGLSGLAYLLRLQAHNPTFQVPSSQSLASMNRSIAVTMRRPPLRRRVRHRDRDRLQTRRWMLRKSLRRRKGRMGIRALDRGQTNRQSRGRPQRFTANPRQPPNVSQVDPINDLSRPLVPTKSPNR